VFRLFTTKKELFSAVVARCFRETLEMFQRAAEGKRGREALDAIGEAYADRLRGDPKRLQVQMQAYAACSDPEICAVVRKGLGDLVAYIERVGGLSNAETARFFAVGGQWNCDPPICPGPGHGREVTVWLTRPEVACYAHRSGGVVDFRARRGVRRRRLRLV
jgi:AcrR family transcriptional regulator